MMLIGYELTAAIFASLVLTLTFIALDRKGIEALIREHFDRYSLAALGIILVFFLVVSLFYVSPTEQLYFDENIYQGVALNILSHFNSLWCQYGTGYLGTCYVNALYHDPVGWSSFIAVAFAIFGVGVNTAYGLELAAGAAAIVFMFFLAGLLSGRKSFAVVATLAFSLMPQLFIWSRTQADVDLPFMTLSLLAFLLFAIFIRRKSLYSLGAFAFSLSMVAYLRIEAILLVPVFVVLLVAFGDHGIVKTAKERAGKILGSIQDNTELLIMLFAFVILLLPEVYYISVQAQNPSYGQNSGQATISLVNFLGNVNANVSFLFGQMNGANFYPMVFHYVITPLAIVGVLFLLFDRRIKNRFSKLLMLALWFATYFLFYTSFYAGAATYGVDSRFMLQLLPSLCLLAAFAVIGIGDSARGIAGRFGREHDAAKGGRVPMIVFTAAVAISSMVLLIYPFATLFPVVTIAQAKMPQQSVILKAMDTFYGNYTVVPRDCIVYSFTPDIWAEVNRSSAQIGYLTSANASLTQSLDSYSCKVFDYGYWCIVPPHHNTTCAQIISNHKLTSLGTMNTTLGGFDVAFYKVGS